MVDKVLVILLSLMQCSVWSKSETPVSKLILQKYVIGKQETCSKTCAGENLICNFQGINLVPPEELEAKIIELLPGKICDGSESSTLTTDSYSKNYDSSKQLFAYNRQNECTSGYTFTPGGPIPLCSSWPHSQQLLICKCQNKRDYKLVAQQISSRISENCNDICSRQDLTCNFEGIDLIPLEELKAQIIDLFPGSFCYNDAKGHFTLSNNSQYTHYSGTDFSYNIENHCTTRYIFISNRQVPNCTTLSEEDKLLICKCQISDEGNDDCQTTNESGLSARWGITDTTVVPATTCSSAVLSAEVLGVLGLGCGVALSCGGMLLCGLVWRERSRARTARAGDMKGGEKGKRNMKWKKKTKKSFGIDDTKCSYNSKTSAATSYKTKGSIKTPSTLRSKDNQIIKSKTKESAKSKSEALKSVVYTKAPESDYETIRH